ncbi:MAG: hypothetical protein ACKVOU_02895 [Cytophagales bacterium]
MKTKDKKSFTIKNSPAESDKEKLMKEFEGGEKTTLEQIFKKYENINLVKS